MSSKGWTMFRLRLTLQGITLLFLYSAPAVAQDNNGRISGTVTDSTGAPVAGAKVTVSSQATNAGQSIATNSSGFYVVPDLGVGTFNVTVEAAGFKKVEKRGFDLVDRGALTV